MTARGDCPRNQPRKNACSINSQRYRQNRGHTPFSVARIVSRSPMCALTAARVSPACENTVAAMPTRQSHQKNRHDQQPQSAVYGDIVPLAVDAKDGKDQCSNSRRRQQSALRSAPRPLRQKAENFADKVARSGPGFRPASRAVRFRSWRSSLAHDCLCLGLLAHSQFRRQGQSGRLHHPLNVVAFLANALVVIKQRQAR